jgi:2-oxo-4-hydroxy-4-carboxy--5-ureidoimidazoline (OHCU) decarboxylase
MKLSRSFFMGMVLLLASAMAAAGPPHANRHGDAKITTDMQEMEQTMQKIHQTKDTDERMRLMQQHMGQMEAAMTHMQESESAQEAKPAGATHMHKHPHGMMKQMMGQMQVQQEEIKRLHDHSKMKR